MLMQRISADVCAKMVEAATRSCQPVISVPPPQAPVIAPANPNLDALAVTLASQSNSIAFGAVVLALIAAVAGVAWGWIVTRNAEREARAMAKKCAEDYIEKWLAEKAPGIIRERVDYITDATLGSGDDATAADDLGNKAG